MRVGSRARAPPRMVGSTTAIRASPLIAWKNGSEKAAVLVAEQACRQPTRSHFMTRARH